MYRTAPKCEHCRKAYQPRKVDQKYCSHRCRQAAYRRRKQTASQPVKRHPDISLIPAICDHCNGSFWAKSKRAQFCSTSCRVMSHRAMRAAIPDALNLIYGLPRNAALDQVDTQPLAKLKSILTECGWMYSHQRRAWVQAIEIRESGTNVRSGAAD